MDQVPAGGGTQAMDSKQLFQTMVKDTLEAFLELEMEEHLGYPSTMRRPRQRQLPPGGSRPDGLAVWLPSSDALAPCTQSDDARDRVARQRHTAWRSHRSSFPAPPTNCSSNLSIGRIAPWSVFTPIFVDGLRVAVRTDKAF